MDSPESALRDARGTGQILKIAYAGGGQPGAVREIVVHRVERARVQAFCLAEGRIKTFLIDRILIVEDDEPVTYVSGREAGMGGQPMTGPTPISAERMSWPVRIALAYIALRVLIFALRWAGVFQ